MLRFRAHLCAALVLLLLLSGCSVLFDARGSVRDPTDGSVTPIDAGRLRDGGASDAGRAVDAGTGQVDASGPDPDDCIYVLAESPQPGDGTQAAPLSDLNNALVVAHDARVDACLGPGIYAAVDAVDVNVRIRGGFDFRLSPDPAFRPQIDGAPFAVTAIGASQLTLQSLDITVADYSIYTPTMIGLYALNVNAIELIDVQILVGSALAPGPDGIDGVDGIDGQAGFQGAGSCGAPGCLASGGFAGTGFCTVGYEGGAGMFDQAGSDGARGGAGGLAGDYCEACSNQVCIGSTFGFDGDPGFEGPPGVEGLPGEPASSTAFVANMWTAAAGEDGQVGGNGSGGSGGGGGGAAPSTCYDDDCTNPIPQGCVGWSGSGGGGGGEGGCGGSATSGGSGGTSTLGILAVSVGSMGVVNVFISVGGPSAGGNGGAGSAGGAGGSGGLGGPIPVGSLAGVGGVGGLGGQGGGGGRGGGGAGGSSICLISAVSDIDAAPQGYSCERAAGALGGDGFVSGPSGIGADFLHIQ